MTTLLLPLGHISFRKNSKGVIGESYDNDLHLRRLEEVRLCEWSHVPFLQEAGFMRASRNSLPMPLSPTLSQMSVTSTKSSQICLFKALLSCLEIIHLKWALIYMLKIIRYHLLSFVTYAWSLLTGAWPSLGRLSLRISVALWQWVMRGECRPSLLVVYIFLLFVTLHFSYQMLAC